MELNNVRPGQEIYFIDKSEGPGVVIYIQGNVVAVGKDNVTLEVTDSGTLIAPGYMAPYEPEHRKGSVIEVTPDNDFELITPARFSQLREEYEVIPQGTVQSDPEPAPEKGEPTVDRRKLTPAEEKAYEAARKKKALEEDEEEKEKQESREDVDHLDDGSPDFEPSDDSLYLTANLKSWGDNAGIQWPKGFPQDWMERIYKDLPDGSSEERDGQPVIKMPGGKGPGVAPDAKVDLEKEFNDASKKAQEAAKVFEAAVVAAEAADASGDKEMSAKKEVERKKAEKDFEKAKDLFLEVKKKIGGEEGVWVRPPDETTYDQTPGRHMPKDVSFGKAGLRQALKHLSNKYKKTLGLVDSVEEAEKRVDQYQKELDLVLRLRKKQVKDVSTNPNDPHYVVEEGEKGAYDPSRILNLLKKLKERELRKKPYLFSTDRTTDDIGDVKVIPSERDRVMNAAASTGLFSEEVGGEPTFFDLPPEDVDILIQKEVEKNGPMDSKEVAARAKEYAQEYREFLKKNTEWKDLSEEIQKYLRSKHSLVVSDEQSDRIEKEMYSPGKRDISIKGRDASGSIKEMTLPTQTLFDDVVHPIISNYEKRVKYLQKLQAGRKNYLAKEKSLLRRELVDKKEGRVEPIDEAHYKDSIISLFKSRAKGAHSEDTAKQVPSKYRIHHGLPALEEKNKELTGLDAEAAKLKEQLGKLEGDVRTAYAPYERAVGDAELLRDDVLTIQETVQGTRLLEVVDEINDMALQIKKLVSQREFASKFPSRGKNRSKEVTEMKEIANGIRAAIEEINTYKITYTKDVPKKYLQRVSDVLIGLRKAVSAYEATARPLEEKIEQLSLELEEIRAKRDMVAEEIN